MNIRKLLNVYDEWQPELQVTLRKLVIVSLTEVFKDLLPSYQIKHQDDPSVKRKYLMLMYIDIDIFRHFLKFHCSFRYSFLFRI